MTNSEISKVEGEIIAARVAKRSALVDTARRSSITDLELFIRLVAFAGLVAYFQVFKVDLGGVLFGFTVYFLVLYSRDSKRRERRIDAIVELLDLNDSHTIMLKTADAEPTARG